MIGSSLAALLLVAVALPIGLTMRGTTTVQTVAAGTGQTAPAAQPADPAPAPGVALQDDAQDDADGVRVELRAGDDFALTIQVISGDNAASEASDAAASATETLEVDGITVWVEGSGDERTVSTLVEPDEFVRVTGPADDLDRLIDVLRNGGFDMRGDRQGLGLGDPEWETFFEQFENGDFSFDIDGLDIDGLNLDDLLKDFDGNFSFDGEFPFEDFQGFGDLEEFFGPNGSFDFEHNFDGDFPFGDLDQFFGPDGEFNFDGNFDQFFGPNGGPFQGCITIDGSRDAEPFMFEFPPGCSANG